MNASAASPMVERALSILLIASAWSCYLPLGIKYATIMAAAIMAGLALRRRLLGGVGAQSAHSRSLLAATLALLAWLVLSSSWSPAPWTTMAAHLAHYSLLLVVPLLAASCAPQLARRALHHFVVASTFVATLFAMDRLAWLPASAWVWHTTVDAQGNQRIATSVLLALGSGLALWLGANGTSASRWAWRASAALCLVGVAWQDRRTGMLVLPVMLVAWALARQPDWRRRFVMALFVSLAAAASWFAFDGVQARFAEGMTELRSYKGSDNDASSWGQRLRLWQLTATMIEERPLVGHGLASWQGLWRNRVTPGSAVAPHTTPHSTYLLLAQQGGLVALALWLWLLAGGLRHALRARAAGVPALMAWTALATTGLFNVVLRDAKFGLPLLLLVALAIASAPDRRSPTPSSPPS